MGVVKLADYRPQLEVVEHRVAELEEWLHSDCKHTVRSRHAFWTYSTSVTDCYGCVAQDIRLQQKNRLDRKRTVR